MNNQNEHCPCKREKCVRHGNCQACKENHHTRETLTSCERMEAKRVRAEEKLKHKQEKKTKHCKS